MIHHASDLTLRDALARYFEANGFGSDGGYADKWVVFKLGPLPLPFPNTEGRVRAVRYHDLHHILTGYSTEFIGEFEISAWEIGSGCRDFFAAWHLNLGGLFGGVVFAPRRTFAAFVRGRHTDNFYGREYAPLLELSVEEALALAGTAREDAAPTAPGPLGTAAASASLVVDFPRTAPESSSRPA
jgi:hypothetical protein